MDDQEIAKLISEAIKVVKNVINYGELWLEVGDMRELGAVSAQVLSKDSASLLINKGVQCEDQAIKLCKELQRTGKMDYDIFTSALCQSIEKLDMGVLLKLIEELILSFTRLLSNGQARDYLAGKTGNSATIRENSQLKHLWRLIGEEAFSIEKKNSSENEVDLNIPKSFLVNFVQDCLRTSDFDCLMAVIEVFNSYFSSKNVKKYIVELFLTEMSVCPPLMSVMEAFNSVQDLPGESSMEYQCLSQLLVLTSEEVLMKILTNLLINYDKINWKFLLASIKFALGTIPSFKDSLSDFVKRTVDDGIADADSNKLLCALLVSQAMKSADYKAWFEECIGKKHLSQKQVPFLISTLTAIVPLQPAHVLKAYLEVLSRQPDPSIREFIQLVRTRLSDLKATTGNHSRGEAEEQLKKWMEEYKKTRNIPQGMIKASVFLSPFFVGHVLPLLLSPSESDQELREKLIQDLLKRGKIPKKMYTQYISGKKSEVTNQEGVNEDVVSSKIEEMVKKILSAVKSPENLRDVFGIVDRYCHELKTAVGSTSLPVENCLDLLAPALLPWQIEVVDRLISFLCQETFSLDADTTLRVVASTLEVVYHVEVLFWPCLVRLWELVQNMIWEASDTLLRGLSSLVISFLLSHRNFTQPIKSASSTITDSTDFSLYLIQCLPVNASKAMKASYSFLWYTFKLLNGIEYENIPQQVLEKLWYLHNRVNSSSNEDTKAHVKEGIVSKKKFQLSFTSWISWELDIAMDEDFLELWERETYMENTVEIFTRGCDGDSYVKEDQEKMVKVLFATLCQSQPPSYLQGVSLLQKLLWTFSPNATSGDSLLTQAVENVMEVYSHYPE